MKNARKRKHTRRADLTYRPHIVHRDEAQAPKPFLQILRRVRHPNEMRLGSAVERFCKDGRQEEVDGERQQKRRSALNCVVP